ncbi:unnamed protein product [Meloidogyne enterolobii]|uniref:Uncharacterized protein n=2 Tax=Meloidogyne enterolobii TaxID=390850 RepID=A0ACB0XSU2_MELEN|nr:unnamed protein product [Meloidogyne enterolobii]
MYKTNILLFLVLHSMNVVVIAIDLFHSQLLETKIVPLSELKVMKTMIDHQHLPHIHSFPSVFHLYFLLSSCPFPFLYN